MTPNTLHILHAQAHALPVAILFSRKLLAEKSTVAVTAKPANDRHEDSNYVRATKMTTVLKNIQGYMHGGIND